jgi:uncharacterized protein (TIGR03086 family)
MNPKKVFHGAVQQASNCMRHVVPAQLSNSTPCSEWKLQDLLNHMVYEVLWVPEMVAGKTVSEVGDKYEGDALGSNFAVSWREAAVEALAAVEAADLNVIAHLSYADVPITRYINEIGADILVHTWDVAQALKCTLTMDPQITAAVYNNTLPHYDEMAASGLFGTPVDVPQDAGIQPRLLAIFGRRETYATL